MEGVFGGDCGGGMVGGLFEAEVGEEVWTVDEV